MHANIQTSIGFCDCPAAPPTACAVFLGGRQTARRPACRQITSNQAIVEQQASQPTSHTARRRFPGRPSGQPAMPPHPSPAGAFLRASPLDGGRAETCCRPPCQRSMSVSKSICWWFTIDLLAGFWQNAYFAPTRFVRRFSGWKLRNVSFFREQESEQVK